MSKRSQPQNRSGRYATLVAVPTTADAAEIDGVRYVRSTPTLVTATQEKHLRTFEDRGYLFDFGSYEPGTDAEVDPDSGLEIHPATEAVYQPDAVATSETTPSEE